MSEFSFVGLQKSRQAEIFGWTLISVQVIINLSSNIIITLEIADFLALRFLIKCLILNTLVSTV